ncbi:MAG: SPOR domain-containing protein [Prevotellaceae bacterium]|nr:SPOR domain-containing protein [Prevotellaceae bacterium]MDO4931379.1 SPOR domain-containing protein [Prevotellaceae bacterium]
MRKYVTMCAAVCAALVSISCGSSKESAYRKAYEKAKAQEMAQQQAPEQQEKEAPVQQTPVVTPLVEAPAQSTVTDNNDNVPVRSENITVVDGSGLKAYSVVVGSFGVRANADGVKSTLVNAGYNAQVAYNSERNMYRVVASTFDSKANAVESRNSLRAKYPDAWLLMKK